MPKSELLRRIDESQQGALLIERDVHDPTETSTPNTPEGVRVTAVQDGILIEVDFNIDTAHLHPRFQAFIVYVKPADSEVADGSGMEAGRFSDSDWVWRPRSGGYTGWLVALSAISNTGQESAKTDWYYCVVSTFYDDFSDYGGDESSDLESLWWLQVAQFTLAEGWDASNISSTFIEGDTSMNTGDYALGTGYPVMVEYIIDLSVEGRFGNSDYVLFSVYRAAGQPDALFRIYISSDAYIPSWLPGNSYYYDIAGASIALGWNLFKIKKSDFAQFGTPNWANIQMIGFEPQIHNPADGTGWIIDDLRIVKADPDDATIHNDTGTRWNFNDGTWHIYPGNRPGEPAYGYSLGQIELAGTDDFLAEPQYIELTNGRLSAGMYLKGSNGRAGLAFRIEDDTLSSEDMLAVEIDSSTDTLYLVRYEAGSKTTLASASFTAAPDNMVWLGIDFRDVEHENRIKVYASSDPSLLFRSPALQISHITTAAWPDGYGVGLVAHQCNVRFVEFRAGSPEVAQYALRAGHALSAGYTTESPGAALAAFQALPGLVGLWPMSSVQRSTGQVYDLSGQGRHLTYNGNPTFNFTERGMPYLDLDGTGDYLSRADETDLDVLGTETIFAAAVRGLTLGGWFWLDARPAANAEVVAKGSPTRGAGNISYGLWLWSAANTVWRFFMSDDGTNYSEVTVANAVAAWQFVVGRFVPASTVDMYVNGAKSSAATTRAAIFNSGSTLTIGGDGAMDGRAALCFLCTAALPDELIEGLFRQTRGLFGV